MELKSKRLQKLPRTRVSTKIKDLVKFGKSRHTFRLYDHIVHLDAVA